jgi:hypothetical protein
MRRIKGERAHIGNLDVLNLLVRLETHVGDGALDLALDGSVGSLRRVGNGTLDGNGVLGGGSPGNSGRDVASFDENGVVEESTLVGLERLRAGKEEKSDFVQGSEEGKGGKRTFQYSTALAQSSPLGAIGLSLRYSKVISSGANIPARAPPSIDMLAIDMLSRTR